MQNVLKKGRSLRGSALGGFEATGKAMEGEIFKGSSTLVPVRAEVSMKCRKIPSPRRSWCCSGRPATTLMPVSSMSN
jgi:hypothetical protein